MTKQITLDELKRETRKAIQNCEDRLIFGTPNNSLQPLDPDEKAALERQRDGNKAILAALEELERYRARASMTKTVTRYRMEAEIFHGQSLDLPEPDWAEASPVEALNGEWVRYEDYKKLSELWEEACRRMSGAHEPSAPQITHWRTTGDCGCSGTVTGELKLGGRCMHGNQWLPRAHGWQSVPEGGGRFWPDPSQPVGWGLNLETIRRFPPEDAPGLAFACTGCGATISVAFTDASKKFVDAKSLEGWTVHLGCTWCPKCNAQNRQTEPKAPLACACIGCARKPKHGECECGMNCNCRCKLGPLSENRPAEGT